jgi:hypothetical protein
MPWSQAKVSMQQRTQLMTPEQGQHLLAHYRSHPDQVPLYCMLSGTFIDVVAEPQIAALLPRGLRAALRLAQQSSYPRRPAAELEALMHATTSALFGCLSHCRLQQLQQPDEACADISKAERQVVEQWMQQGLLQDLKQAAGLPGGLQACIVLVQLAVPMTVEGAHSSRVAADAVVDCMLEQPQHLASWLKAAGKVADALDGPGALTDPIVSAGTISPLVKALKLWPDVSRARWCCHAVDHDVLP